MKKIGKEVNFLGWEEKIHRKGESTFLRLSDGRIMFAYTEYGTDAADDGSANLCAIYSSDEGESWSEKKTILKKDENAVNIMSPALVNLPDGKVGMFYLRYHKSAEGKSVSVPHFTKSSDGESFEIGINCAPCEGKFCGINDGAIVTKNGRLLWPVSYHGAGSNEEINIQVIYSDDCGETFGVLPGIVSSPYASTLGFFAEPGIYEHEDGTLWLWIRTALGHQYDSLSYDGGVTWLPCEPNLRFTSPDSPMRVKKIGDKVVAVFNPVPYLCISEAVEEWRSPKRTPIVMAISDDDGKSFNKRGVTARNGELLSFSKCCYYLEDDLESSYCYPSMIETEDGLLVSYYHSEGKHMCLRASKILKIYKSEIE